MIKAFSRTTAKPTVGRLFSAGGMSALLFLGQTAPLIGNPTGGAVIAGSATIAGAGKTVTVQQNSGTAIINWQNFFIGAGETTRFIQPSASSAALNRVISGNPSAIYGQLSSNGQIFLINPNGIVVGAGGVINTAGFTASTRDIANADFLSGHLHFTGSSDTGVQNLGTINALGGDIYLVGHTVDNQGTIHAPQGTVGLAAGDDVTLTQAGADNVFIVPSTKPSSTDKQRAAISNSGKITAASAQLKAANGNMYALAINNTGSVIATTVKHQGGHIWLTTDAGTINNSGTLNASATAASGLGGTVTLKTSGLINHSGTTQAGGSKSGGTVTMHASDITLSPGSRVDVSSTQGTGGTVTATASDEIVGTVGSSILASGAQQGGEVELGLSDNADLIFSGAIDTSSSLGKGGEIDMAGGPLLFAQAHLDANGALGGGTALLGGGAAGAAIDGLARSSEVFLDAGTKVSADATGTGDGGHVVLWSDGSVDTGATITARGGLHGGNGGQVEISGLTGFGLSGAAPDLRAPHGSAGTTLLDPHNLTISSTLPNVTNLVSTLSAQIPPTSDSVAGDQFGFAVALSGNFELIGAPDKNSDEGAAYLFNGGALAEKYTDPGNAASDRFGNSVALSAGNALVGANASASAVGSAYLYNLNSNTPLVTYRDPGNSAGDDFGIVVALSSSNALVGAIGVNNFEGAAYLYNLSSNTSLVSYTDPGNASNDYFGNRVALSGSNALLAAIGTNSFAGAAYLYNLSSNTPLVAYTDPGSTGGDAFGSYLALSGSNVLVGASGVNSSRGAAYLYNLSSNTPLLTYTDPGNTGGDAFGVSVALSATNALVGADGTSNSTGTAYLYNLSGNTPLVTYADPVNTSADNLGSSVALSDTHALVGAPGTNNSTGTAYLYNLTDSTPIATLTAQLPPASDGFNGDLFGNAVALSGNYELIGAPFKSSFEGAAYLFNNGAITMKYADPGNAANDSFGSAVALNAGNALVGASGTNNDTGAAYLYNLSSNVPVVNFTDPGNTANDSFGASVALSAGNALVGAEGVSSYAGAAYLYNLSSNTPLVTYTDPPATATDFFGSAVALSASNALVGAMETSNGKGAAYLFGLGSNTPLVTYADPGNTANDNFSSSVALSASNVLVGASGINDYEGFAYLYNLTSNTPMVTYTDPANAANDQFGVSVALNAANALVGGEGTASYTGEAILYNLSSNTPLISYTFPGFTTGEELGVAVALSDTNALIGANHANGSGAAYLYNLTSSTPIAYLSEQVPPASDAASGDQFGSAIALSGSYELIGAFSKNSSEGAAYLFNNGAITLKYTDPGNTPNDDFGGSVALSASRALVGADGVNASVGAGYLYNLTSNTPLVTYTDTGNTANDNFGGSVALSASNALVGAYGTSNFAGAAYLYNLTGNTPLVTYTDPANTSNDVFGLSVALSASNALVGAHGTSNFAGAAYLYNLTGNTPLVTYTNPGSAAYSDFGRSVALNASDALVGADGANGSMGAAYLYNLTGNTPLITYTDPASAAGDRFGHSVALSANNALVGAYGTGNFTGAAYLYDLSSDSPLATLNNPGNTAGDEFGQSVALTADNALVGASGANSSAGAAYLYALSAGAAQTTTTFSANPSTDSYLTPTMLESMLATGNVVLQANTNLTLAADSDIITTSTNGLTLQAGRSIVLGSNITTHGNVTLVGNDSVADGVVAANRDAGTATIDTSAGTIAANTAGVTIRLLGSTGSGASGDINLGAISAGAISVENDSTTGNVTLGGALTASGTVTFNTVGSIFANSAVSSGGFLLLGGAWTQIVQQNGLYLLPAFTDTGDFELQGTSTFQRFAGIDYGTGDYEITDVYGLQGLASPSGSLLFANAELVNTIDASGTPGWNSGAGFVPIGNGTTAYSGSFNGQNYPIDSLFINASSSNLYPALFGEVSSGGMLNQIGLTRVDVSGSSSGYVAALVGDNFGMVAGSYATGSVTGSAGMNPAGLVGLNNGTVETSYATCTVSLGNGIDAGGLVAENEGTVESCYATGTVTSLLGGHFIGGLVGYNGGTIETSYATGAVTGASGTLNVGGLVGNNAGRIETTYSTGAVSGGTNVGGLVGNGNGMVDASYWAQDTGLNVGLFGIGSSGSNTGATPETVANLEKQATFQPQGIGVPNWDFVNTWSTLGDTNTPQLIGLPNTTPPSIGSDSLSGTAFTDGGMTAAIGQTIELVFDNSSLGTATTNSSSGFTFNVSAADLTSGILLIDTTHSGTTYYQANTPASTILGIDVWGGTLRIVADASSNAALAAASTGTFTNANYSVSGGALTTSGSLYVLKNYTLDGNVTVGGTFVTDPASTITSSQPVTLRAGGMNLGGSLTSTAAVTLNSSGTILASGPVSTAGFILAGGTWTQIVGQNSLLALPAFTDTGDFELQGASTFERFAGIDTAHANAYEITDVYGLQGLASPSNSLLSANAELVNNIDASATATWNAAAGFARIGYYLSGYHGYLGTFDGQNYSIDHLAIDTPSANYGVGLFGNTGAGAVIKNVGLTNAMITGDIDVAALIGVNFGTVADCYSTGAVTGNFNVGGLAGANIGQIGNSFNLASVTCLSAGNSVGGLVGANQSGTIENCYSIGAVTAGNGCAYVGGLVGLNDGSIQNTYATGLVTVGTGSTDVGGLVGLESPGLIVNSFWDVTTSGLGVGVGSGPSSGVTAATTAQLQSPNYILANATTAPTFDFTPGTGVWGSNGVTGVLVGGFVTAQQVNNGLPYFQWQYPTPVEVVANNQTVAYGNAINPTASQYSVVPGTAVLSNYTSGTTTLSGSVPVTTGVGTYTGAIGFGSSIQPYLGVTIEQAIGDETIIPAALTITAGSLGKTYGNTVIFAGSAFSTSPLQNGETVGSVTLNSAGATAFASVAGSPYAITASNATGGTFNPANYAITYTTGSLTVNQAPLVITTTNSNKTYGNLNPDLSANFIDNPIPGDPNPIFTTTPTISTTATPFSTVAGGPYAITATGAGTPNYSVTYANTGLLTVNPAPLVITTTNANKTYGSFNPDLSANFTDSPIPGDPNPIFTTNPAISTTAGPFSSVAGGPYPLSATGAISSNYTPTYMNTGVLTVNPAPVTVTADNQGKVYGAPDPALTYSVTGLVGTDTAAVVTGVNLATTTGAGAAAGTHPITVTGGAAQNYSVTDANGTLTVAQAPLTITANNDSKTYDATAYSGDGQGVTYAGFQYSDTAASLPRTLTYSGTSQGATNVGTYTIRPGGYSTGNYTFIYNNAQLIISPATVSVSGISAKSKTFDGTTAATLILTGASLHGVLGHDAVTLDPTGYTATFADAAVATLIPVNVSNLTLTGAQGGNYALAQPTGLFADITSSAIVVPPPAPPEMTPTGPLATLPPPPIPPPPPVVVTAEQVATTDTATPVTIPPPAAQQTQLETSAVPYALVSTSGNSGNVQAGDYAQLSNDGLTNMTSSTASSLLNQALGSVVRANLVAAMEAFGNLASLDVNATVAPPNAAADETEVILSGGDVVSIVNDKVKNIPLSEAPKPLQQALQNGINGLPSGSASGH